jgi:MFS family permease
MGSVAGAARQGASSGGPFRAFKSSNFTFFWLASLLSITSFFMLIIARGALVYELTESPFWVTAVAAASQVPSLVLSVFGGVLADRFSRKAILLVAEGANFLTLLALAILVVTNAVEVWHVLVLALLNGINFALAFPARAAIVPNLVPPQDIANGVALSSIMFSGAQLIGPTIAGALLVIDDSVAFFGAVIAVAAAIPLFTLLRLNRPAWDGQRPRMSMVKSIGEGMEYIRRDQVVMGLMATGLVVVVFGMPYQTVLPVFAEGILHAGDLGLGLLGAVGGLGAIMGSLAVATFSSQDQMKRFLAVGLIGLGLFIALFALSAVFALSLALALLAGFFFQIFMTANFSLLQTLVPDHLRGRVLSVRFIIFGLSPIGTISLGIAAEEVGTALATAATGVICLVAGLLVLLLFPALRRTTAAASDEAGAPAEPAHTGGA